MGQWTALEVSGTEIYFENKTNIVLEPQELLNIQQAAFSIWTGLTGGVEQDIEIYLNDKLDDYDKALGVYVNGPIILALGSIFRNIQKLPESDRELATILFPSMTTAHEMAHKVLREYQGEENIIKGSSDPQENLADSAALHYVSIVHQKLRNTNIWYLRCDKREIPEKPDPRIALAVKQFKRNSPKNLKVNNSY